VIPGGSRVHRAAHGGLAVAHPPRYPGGGGAPGGGWRRGHQPGAGAHFDEVIFACHSDQALALLADASDGERAILGNMPIRPTTSGCTPTPPACRCAARRGRAGTTSSVRMTGRAPGELQHEHPAGGELPSALLRQPQSPWTGGREQGVAPFRLSSSGIQSGLHRRPAATGRDLWPSAYPLLRGLLVQRFSRGRGAQRLDVARRFGAEL
jgi:hypothetical protein